MLGLRGHCRHVTGLLEWEFLALAEHLKPLIERPRGENAVQRPEDCCKWDYKHRLLYVLSWMTGGEKIMRDEFHWQVPKSTLHRDLRHILGAIVEGLDTMIRWPDAVERHRLANERDGVFHNTIGYVDVQEHQIQRSKDPQIEYETFSGKKKVNTRKTLSVIDRNGYFRYVAHGWGGRTNDRDCYRGSELYLESGKYFSADEHLASDGTFRGDGDLLCSYDDPGAAGYGGDLFDAVFKEGRMQIENAFNRQGSWFARLGVNRKYWNCKDDLLDLTVHAATRLHNWIMYNRALNYDAATNPNYLFRRFH